MAVSMFEVGLMRRVDALLCSRIPRLAPENGRQALFHLPF